MSAKKFFEDNHKRISAQSHPVEYNTNQGLPALAQQVDDIQTQLNHQNAALSQIVELLRSR